MDFEKMAEEVVSRWESTDDLGPCRPRLIEEVTTALRAAATVPEGMVRVGTGDMRYVVPLLITADKVLTSPGSWCWKRAQLHCRGGTSPIRVGKTPPSPSATPPVRQPKPRREGK